MNKKFKGFVMMLLIVILLLSFSSVCSAENNNDFDLWTKYGILPGLCERIEKDLNNGIIVKHWMYKNTYGVNEYQYNIALERATSRRVQKQKTESIIKFDTVVNNEAVDNVMSEINNVMDEQEARICNVDIYTLDLDNNTLSDFDTYTLIEREYNKGNMTFAQYIRILKKFNLLEKVENGEFNM